MLEAILAAGLPVHLVLVDRHCAAMQVAAKARVDVACVERTTFDSTFDRVEYTDRVVEALRAHGIELVAMAGFGTVLAQSLFAAYPERVRQTIY